MMTEVAKIVECGLLATLTQVSVMVIMRFLEKANRECLDNGTPSTTTMSDKCPYKTNYPMPIPLDEWDTRCHITYTWSTSNQNIPNNEPTPFSLEHSELGEKANISESLNFDIEEEYAKEIGNPYSRKFDEYKRVFDNEVENLSNEYALRIGKKGYEEEELWRSGDEKTDYKPSFVDVKTFEVKKYSFKRWQSFICITKQDDDALPLGRVIPGND
ncbi:hypothetical protein Tco_1028567 [Tanacetum coccineum]|uniref:Uncharacterized protein n=1 Tax=Tanacetum coccineum TaxID=301880 RepID=A0ABQ5G177_9ASTR